MDHANAKWIEVVVGTSVALADGVASALIGAVEGARAGVQVRKGEVVFWIAPQDLEQTLADVRSCLRTLAEEGWQLDPDRVRAGSLAPEEEWRDAWKKHFHVTRLTRQIVVVPSWESHKPKAGDIAIQLDPGQAFGTGAHASTQLVLEEMQELRDGGAFPSPARIFDLGTGSGILAIAAARFWPESAIVAIDVDPLSISATEENTRKNKVQSQIAVSTTPLSDVEGQFPLVLANMQAHILRQLCSVLVPRLELGALLIISGILSSQIDSLCDHFHEHGAMTLVGVRHSKLNPDWSSALLRRPLP